MTTLRCFGEIFGVSRATANLPKMAAAAVRHGFAVLPVWPGEKRPMCTLTRVEAKRQEGHPCGLHHAITDEEEARRVFRRLDRLHPELNIAIEVGRSRMILADCDSAESRQAFSKLPDVTPHPTVRTPGTYRSAKAWTHEDGGHYWFTLPDGFELPDSISSSLKDASGADIYFRNRIALVPPSTRAEGPYELVSDLMVAPQWLLDTIIDHITNTHASHRHTNDDPIDEWASSVSWWELLVNDANLGQRWEAYDVDGCGCTIYTRPGDDYSNPKSATAHEPGCARMDEDQRQGPLHLWTDNPPDFLSGLGKDISKLQYLAARDYDGDIGQAMRAEDIEAIDYDVMAMLDAIPHRPTR